MALENAKKFMEELDSNEKALEILQGQELSDDEKGIAALASAARETGYDVSDEEIKEFFAASKQKIAQAADQAATEVQKLSREEIDAVAGGKKGHYDCVDTYRDDENCWVHDSCKKFIVNYWTKDENGEIVCENNSFCKGAVRKYDCNMLRVGVHE